MRYKLWGNNTQKKRTHAPGVPLGVLAADVEVVGEPFCWRQWNHMSFGFLLSTSATTHERSCLKNVIL